MLRLFFVLVVVTVLAFFRGGGVTASCADAAVVTHQSGESVVQSVQHSRKMLWFGMGRIFGRRGWRGRCSCCRQCRGGGGGE
ncbi:hypothetical protein NFJ02_23g53110 [Pycnococcus provasolii]